MPVLKPESVLERKMLVAGALGDHQLLTLLDLLTLSHLDGEIQLHDCLHLRVSSVSGSSLSI